MKCKHNESMCGQSQHVAVKVRRKKNFNPFVEKDDKKTSDDVTKKGILVNGLMRPNLA